MDLVSWLISTVRLAPDWAIALAVLVAAVAAALLVHSVLVRCARRLTVRSAFFAMLLPRISGPSRLALIILAVSIATQLTPYGPDVIAVVTGVLVIALIVLCGWIASITIGLAADLYLRRFALDAEDNLLARKHYTQVRILQRSADTLVGVVTAAAVLMTFEPVRHYGTSLLASAGVVGIVVGLSARPMLSNLIAGMQIAMTQPIRLEDGVMVENEFGSVEEIAASYVVIRLWDHRRMIVPLTYFIEKPFQNWTRQPGSLIGSVFVHVDHAAPVDRIREKLNQIVAQSTLWDRKVVNLQVHEAGEWTLRLRALVSAANPGVLNDLQAEVRENLITFLRIEHPGALPRWRADLGAAPAALRDAAPAVVANDPAPDPAPGR
jgi:small-conductance mechanosensitive channel